MRRLLLALSMLVSLGAACIPVHGDKILAGELALVIPAFQSVDPAQAISFSPIPGMTRIFKAAEVAALARKFNLDLPAASLLDVCFESSAAVLTEERIHEVITTAVGLPIASLQIVDFSRAPLPEGRLEFPHTGLSQTPASTGDAITWRGRLITDSGRNYPIWAKVIVIVETPALVASMDLPKGKVLTESDVVMSGRAHYPLPTGILASLDDVVGHSVRNHVPAGRILTLSAIDQPNVISNGDTVHVDASSGEAHVTFDAVAQTGGHKGDLVMIRNPNGRTFKARVIEKGRVEVRALTGN